MNKIKVGIFVFNEVEVLDFAGPFEMFLLTTNKGNKAFDAVLIAKRMEYEI